MSDRGRLLLLFFFSLLMTASFVGLRLDVPLLAIELGASAAIVGVLMGAFALLSVVLAIHAGRWVDAAGAGVPMMACAAANALALVAAFLAPNLWVLFIVNAVVGLANVAFHLSLTAAAGSIGRPEDRTANFSWITVANGIGIFLGPVATGHIVDASSHASAFLLLALPPAIVAIVLGFLRLKGGSAPRVARPPIVGRGIRDLLAMPELVRILVIAAVLGVGWDLYGVLVPVYGAEIGLSAGTIGNILGSFGISIFIVRLFIPFLLRVMHEWQILVTALFICAPVFLLIPLTKSPALLMALTFLFGVAWGAVQPIITSLLFSAAPSGRVGEVTGVRMMLHTALQTVMPAVFGGLSTAVGMIPAFWAVGAMMLGGGWATRARWRRAA